MHLSKSENNLGGLRGYRDPVNKKTKTAGRKSVKTGLKIKGAYKEGIQLVIKRGRKKRWERAKKNCKKIY